MFRHISTSHQDLQHLIHDVKTHLKSTSRDTQFTQTDVSNGTLTKSIYFQLETNINQVAHTVQTCLLYTSDAADE